MISHNEMETTEPVQHVPPFIHRCMWYAAFVSHYAAGDSRFNIPAIAFPPPPPMPGPQPFPGPGDDDDGDDDGFGGEEFA